MSRDIRVSLPAAIVYVSGSVNGKDYVWTLDGKAWKATVDRASDEKYAVSLTAINAAGTSASYQFTLNYGMLALITDRTQADVDAVIAALSEIEAGRGTPADVLLLSDNKGSYNYTDLNRVAGAVLYVAEELEANGYSVTVTAKQGWTETDIPTQADIDQYLADIAEIRSALPVPADAPEVPTMPLDYRKANDIESILILVDKLVQNIAKSWFYSGDLYSNEIKY